MKIELELQDDFVSKARFALGSPKATSSHAAVASMLEEVVRQMDANALDGYLAVIHEIDRLWDHWEILRPEVEGVALSEEFSAQTLTALIALSRGVDKMLETTDDVRLRAINAWMHANGLPAKKYT